MNEQSSFQWAELEPCEILLVIDPGSESSGYVIFEHGELLVGGNWTNGELFLFIDQQTMSKKVKFEVVYEDIRPFTSRFNMATINTCKVIGRLEYVLQSRLVMHKAITRNEVKNYVFKAHADIAVPRIEKKILKKGKLSKKGEPLKPSFQYVDDRIVQAAMAIEWDIPKPKPGRTNKYGISTHAWQALGVASVYLKKIDRFVAEPGSYAGL